MVITNPNKLINVQELSYFEGKLAAKYQTKSISAVDGLSASTVEGAITELLGKINALPSSIVPKGTKAFSALTPATDLVAANVGFMWNISDGFTTTSDFVEGAGQVIPAGANVYVANPSTGVYKYDVFQGMVDTSNFKTKQTAVSDSDATTSGSGIIFVDSVTQNENGEITVHKKSVSDVVASTDGQGGNSGLMSAAQAEKLAGIDDELDGKADKVSGATSGNFAGLDANGNLTDSGSKASDFKTKQTAVTSPSASGNALAFIDTISQNANGEIEATKKNIEIAADSDIDEIFA